jgi:hypothetical protein
MFAVDGRCWACATWLEQAQLQRYRTSNKHHLDKIAVSEKSRNKPTNNIKQKTSNKHHLDEIAVCKKSGNEQTNSHQTNKS